MSRPRAHAALALVFLFLAGLVPAFVAAPARAATADCIPTSLWSYDAGYGPRTLHRYTVGLDLKVNPTATIDLPVQGAQGLGDIALLKGTMYGIAFDTTDPNQWLQRIDMNTGQMSSVWTDQSQVTVGYYYNSLTAMPDGALLAGSHVAPSGQLANVLRINPNDGRVTNFGTYPAGYVSAGDFYALPDGQVIGFAQGGGTVALLRWGATGGAGQVIGTVGGATGWGAAASAGWVYVLTGTGIARINLTQTQLQSLAPSFNPVPLADEVAAGPANQWGLTGVGDAHSCDQAPTLSVVKTGEVNDNGHETPRVGDTITYTYRVTNAGDLPITDVRVTDPKVGDITCPSKSLAVGASMTCTATYVITAADLEVGSLLNSARVSGLAPAVQGQARETVSAAVVEPKRLTVALPETVDQVSRAVAGKPASFDPLKDAKRVSPSSIKFPTKGQPAGAVVSESGARMTVRQGTWTVDPKTGAVAFTPRKGVKTAPAPARYVGSDIAGNVTNPKLLRLLKAGPTAKDAADKAAGPITSVELAKASAASRDSGLEQAGLIAGILLAAVAAGLLILASMRRLQDR